MEIFKVIGVGITGAIAVLLVRSTKPEFAAPVSVAAGIVLLIMLVNSLNSAVVAFTGMVLKSGVNDKLFSGLLKIIGIGYLTEYAAGICEDCGVSWLGSKIQFGGKLTIFLLSLPILQSLLDVIEALVK